MLLSVCLPAVTFLAAAHSAPLAAANFG